MTTARQSLKSRRCLWTAHATRARLPDERATVITVARNYLESEVRQGHRWLGHWPHHTELAALHPAYRPGRENAESNKQHNAYPKITYVRTETAVEAFVRRFAGSHLVCYSLNPRPRIVCNERGFVRSAREDEVAVSQNLLLDFDFLEKRVTRVQGAAFREFLDRTDGYLGDLGLLRPETAFTGRGYHLLFAYPPIRVAEHPDIRDRGRMFRDQFAREHRHDLARLEVKLDATQDLRRMVRVYGTAKPSVGILSHFYGGRRVEDSGLREYLLSMPLPAVERRGRIRLATTAAVPVWFGELLAHDEQTRALWEGRGKPAGSDQSRSGFDFSLAQRLLALGHTDIAELATILALRPDGSIQQGGKSEQWILRTIAGALVK